jgi:hypothetical protein
MVSTKSADTDFPPPSFKNIIVSEYHMVLEQCDPANLVLKLRSAAPKNFPIIVTGSVEIEAKLLGTNVDIYGGSAEKARVISAPAS